MKKQFLILKDRPNLEIRLTRDSVCAGDDVGAPHEKTVVSPSFLNPVALASSLSSGYLPVVSGIGHTWDCILNGKVVARISHDGTAATVDETRYDTCNHVHFVYHSAGH